MRGCFSCAGAVSKSTGQVTSIDEAKAYLLQLVEHTDRGASTNNAQRGEHNGQLFRRVSVRFPLPAYAHHGTPPVCWTCTHKQPVHPGVCCSQSGC